MSDTFATTMPYDDHPRWAARAELISAARARQDLEPSRSPARPGLRHLVRVLRALASGQTVALYSACPGNVELLALLLARFLFRSRVGPVLFTGDMWEPSSGLRLWLSRLALRYADGVIARWVVHTRADVECFVDVWGIPRDKIDVAPFGYTPDWGRYEPLERDRPYVFAGGTSHREFGPLLDAARALPDVPFVFTTTLVGPEELPPNVELLPLDRPTYQAALVGAAVVVVPLRPGLRRSVGQQTYLNAMRAGKVTIVPRAAGVDEYLDSGVNGIVVGGAVEDYVAAIRWSMAASNSRPVAEMGERARSSVSEHPFGNHPGRIIEIVDSLAADEPADGDEATRVAMLVAAYLPVVGGAQRQLSQLLSRFPPLSIASTVVCRSSEGSPAEEDVAGGRVVRVPVDGSEPARSLGYTIGALRRLRRDRPDVVHAFDLLSPTTTALAAKLLWRTPVVAKVLRGGQLGDLERLRVKPFGLLRLRAMRRLLDRVVAISDEIEGELLAAGFEPRQIVRIHNGVDVDNFAPAEPAEVARLRRLAGLPDAPIAVFTGRLNGEKRVDLLIDRWPAVAAAVEGATLVIVGNGPERARLTRAAGPGIRFVGQVDDPTPYLKAADVFVLPSETEGLSNSLLEAMATGLAVVCTKVGGAADVIDHYGNGVLVPPDDPDALGDALIELLAAPGLRDSLGEAARTSMLDGYSLTATAGHLADLYHELARPRRRRSLGRLRATRARAAAAWGPSVGSS